MRRSLLSLVLMLSFALPAAAQDIATLVADRVELRGETLVAAGNG